MPEGYQKNLSKESTYLLDVLRGQPIKLIQVEYILDTNIMKINIFTYISLDCVLSEICSKFDNDSAVSKAT